MVISGAPDILRKIVEAKLQEVERLKVELPVSELQDRIDARAAPLNFAGALTGSRVRVIAEIKKPEGFCATTSTLLALLTSTLTMVRRPYRC